MIAALVLAVALQQQTIVRDSMRPDTTKQAPRRRGIPAPIRKPVTAELRATAYKDTVSRDLIARARAARLRQDSSITGYDAKVAQRFSVKAAVGSVTLERLAWRQESAARVQWQRGIGAHIDVTGARMSIPILGSPTVEPKKIAGVAADPSLIPLPYFPGQEPLWVGQFAARPDVNENSMINPLANGAEAYYTFKAGGETTIRLGNGETLVVRQIDVRPREPAVNALVGSLWLDAATGQVVRAAYRMAAPGRGNVSVSNDDTLDAKGKVGLAVARAILKTIVPTMVAEITDIVVEYQRVGGYWMPRSQVMEGYVKSSFATVPVTIENGFRFESINETSSLAPFAVDTMSTRARKVGPDSVVVTSLDQCRTNDTRTVTAYRADSVPIQMRIPCDLAKLVKSPELPASAFDEGEEIFGTADRDALIAQALSLADQAPFAWNPFRMPDLQYGVSFTRYNRIEGWSTGLLATQQMGAGFDISALGRIATRDHRLRGELSIGRSSASHTIRVTGYDRLVPMGDWETPLTFGSGLSAFFFGRDDAFYYRAAGGELTWNTQRGMKLDWRMYRQRELTALQQTDYSVAGTFIPNIGADEGWYSGVGVRYRGSHGLDPRGLRTSTDIRLEGATGDSTFGKGSMELTFLRGLGSVADAGLTVSGGSTVGGLPIQGRWYLGGTQTVRGLDPSPLWSGNSYWFARGELGRRFGPLRLSAFGDFGSVSETRNPLDGREPAKSVGLGFSFFDGVMRFDIARGLYPAKHTRVSFYLGSRF
jgi:hypothetical protein